MLAGREDRAALADVQVVGRGDVDDVDGGVGQQGVQDGVGLRDAERLGPRRATLRGAAQHAANVDADPAQGLHVDRADESRPDDGGADVGDRFHRC